MPVEERRRLAFRRIVAESWGEEAADTLFEMVAPAGQDPATRQDVEALRRDTRAEFDEFRRWVDARFDRLEERIDSRAETTEQRLTAVFERRIADAVTAQTRTLVYSQLGALVTVAALAFGLR